MSKFRVGEIAIGVCPRDRGDMFGMHGAEVTVVAPLRQRRFATGEIEWCYIVSTGPGTRYRAMPEWLRRREDKISWDKCIWQPLRAAQPIARAEALVKVSCPVAGPVGRYSHNGATV